MSKSGNSVKLGQRKSIELLLKELTECDNPVTKSGIRNSIVNRVPELLARIQELEEELEQWEATQ